jgi:dihydroorotate dehydrogenase electron transfer subunit
MPANREARLLAREPLEGLYVLLTFRHPEVAATARAGQYVMIKAGTSPDLPLRRPFSVMSVDPKEESFTLFLKAVGAGSRALADLRVGDIASCLGPLGRPFTPPPGGTEALLVAGGYGIAPFVIFCDELRREGHEARVFYGGRTVADLQIRSAFADRGVPLVAATEDGSFGHHGRVTEPLEAHLEVGGRAATLYACGPDAMLHSVARLAARRGLPAQVSLDPWMGCGIGTCLGCVVPIQRADDARPRYRCACTEGPVFDAVTVVWTGQDTSVARRRALEETPA